MITSLRLLLLCTALALTSGAHAADHSAPASPPTIDPDAPEWRELFDALQAPATVQAVFVEHRSFSFRPEPVILKGTLRLTRDHGVSLDYAPPEARTVIVDERGVLLRDERGRTRTAPREAAAGTAPLLHILQFNLPALRETFHVQGRQEGERWQLQFEPKPSAPPRTPRRILVGGTNDQVERIELQPSERQRVAISIVETETDVTFSPEELQRYFRRD